MNVLLDTNVLVAAFVASGQCGEVFEACRLAHRLITSERILVELRAALVRKVGVSPATAKAMVRLVRLVSVVAPGQALGRRVCRHPQDDHVLAAAVAGKAHCIVTGDRDLLDLGEFEGVPILRPAAFWRFEEK